MEEKSLLQLEFDKVLGLIAGYAGSQAGKDLIVGWRPAIDRQTVEFRLLELDEWMRLLDEGRHVPVGGIREMRDLLQNLQHGGEMLAGEDLLRVRANIEVGTRVRKALTDADLERLPRMRQRLNAMPVLDPVGQRITDAINDRGEIRDDATPALATIRRELGKTRQEVERRLGDFLQTGDGEMFSDRFFTQRNDRYVVPVKSSFQSTLQGIIHDSSGSGQTVFMEPLEFLGLNNKLARLRSEEREEVRRILRQLTDLLAGHRSDLGILFDGLVFFDGLQARGRFARQFDAKRPEIGPDGRVDLVNGRHPLLHPECVPLDLTLGPPMKQQPAPGPGVQHVPQIQSVASQTGPTPAACIVITGPNGGGKTVAMKILGINALLMQTGCYVLAGATSRLPVFTEILSDIGEQQSIENHLSTFTSHLQRLKEIIAAAGPGSLVLIDEIGVGTNPEEGAALARGVLEAVLRRGALALVTSHFEPLKSMAYTTPGFANAAMEFDEQAFRPTFRFIMGIPGRSNALAMARLFGLPDEVLAVMSAGLQGTGGNEEALIGILERERMQAERLRRSWEEKERDVSRRQADLAVQMKKLETFRRTRRDEVVESFEGSLKGKMRELEGIIHDLKRKLAGEPVTEADPEKARAALKQARGLVDEINNPAPDARKKEIDASPPEPPESFKVGDLVVWREIPRPGVIEDLDLEKGRVVILCNNLRFVAPLAQVRKFASGKGKTTTTESSGGVIASRPSVSDRLDLRGHRVEEALQQAEAYLKDAAAQRVPRVFLVHGKGTGALQRAIHEFLKRSPWRDKFRFGRYGEGDLGVTVVVFDPAADVEKQPAENQLEVQARRRLRKLRGRG